MNKFISIIAGLLLAGSSFAASLSEDITAQGNVSFWHKTLTAQQLATMVSNYEVVTAANTITYLECGSTFFLSSATEFASTLPTPIAGCGFKFIVDAAPVGTAYTIVTPASATIIDGTTVVNGGVIGCANEHTITFTASAAISGDWVELVSDGTNWYITGQAFAATGIACTAA